MKSVVIVAVLSILPSLTDASNATTKRATCPNGFKLYERTPTARNKFTKQWCLKVVENEDVYDRPTARSVCMDYDAVISTVANQKELDDVNALIRKNNKRVAVDGVFNPKCRGFSDWRMRKFGGLCAKEKELFILEDDHTDPAFIFKKWTGEPPTTSDKYQENGDSTEIFTIAECLSLNNLIALGNQGNLKDFLCGEEPDKQVGEVAFFGVLCGLQSADPKCAEGFTLFHRTPTAKNNFTKEWCIAVVDSKLSENRDDAVSVCATFGSTITLPENANELEFITKNININDAKLVAVDGEVTPKCKHVAMKHRYANSTKDCQMDTKLFEYYDSNTDPTFIKTQFIDPIPNRRSAFYDSSYPIKRNYAGSCMVVTKSDSNNVTISVPETYFCNGQLVNKNSANVQSVACGRHPN
ncbi:unnamed protein product [Caenorhabditis sp. 36 PRJEB53466]|nr:unnamed protein product [Caenorhabditis sp. 36 PRJEB53466]